MKIARNKARNNDESYITRMIMIIIFSDPLRVSCGEDFFNAHLKSLERRLRKQ